MERIEKESAELEPGYRSLLQHTRQLLAASPSRGLLQQLASGWSMGRRRLDSWQVALKGRSASLQQSILDLRAQQEWWNTAAQLAESERVPPGLRKEIVGIRADFREVQGKVLTRRNQILNTQSRIALLQIEVDTVDEEIREALAEARGRLLRLDAPPIWSPSSGSGSTPQADSAPPAQQLKAAPAIRLIKEYLLAIAAVTVGMLGTFLATLLVFVWLRRRFASPLEASGAEGQILAKALTRPFSLAFLVSALLLIAWGSDLGAIVQGLGWLMMIIPLLRIVPLTLPQETRRSVWYLFAWLCLESLLTLLPSTSLSARLLSIVLAVSMAFGLVWLSRMRRQRGLETGGLILNRVMQAGICVCGGVVIGEIAGSTDLSRFLIEAASNAMLGGFVISAFSFLAKAAIGILSKSVPEGAGQALRTPVLKWSMGAVQAFTGLLFFKILLTSFEFDGLLWEALVQALNYRIKVGAISFSVASVLTFLAVVAAAFAISHLLRLFFAPRIYNRMSVARGTGAAISKLLHYAVLTIGFFVALAAAGIELDRFALLAGGMGVGVAFGLQNIVNNFVSGLILLFERPVHVGDIVTVGGTSGEIADIGIRASTIRTWDGADVVIPNASLITSDFTNWSLSEDRRRSEVRVGAAYGSDPELVISILKATAEAHRDVHRNPAPYALFKGFGESSLDFELFYWTQISTHLAVNSDLHRAIYQRFAEAGIEIPFPRRDLHVRLEPAELAAAGLPPAGKQTATDRGTRAHEEQSVLESSND